jgi:hypothetical protein
MTKIGSSTRLSDFERSRFAADGKVCTGFAGQSLSLGEDRNDVQSPVQKSAFRPSKFS